MNVASKRIKIAFFSEDFSRQAKGTAIVVQKLAEQYLNNFSDRIELVLIRKAGICRHPLAGKMRNIEIKVYQMSFFSTLISYLIFFIKNREEFDAVIFNRNVYPGFWLLNSKKFILLLYDAPVMDTYKIDLSFDNRMLYSFLKYVGRHFLDSVIAISEDARKNIIAYFKMRPLQVSVIYGAASDIFRPFSNEEKQETKKVLENQYGIYTPFILDVSRLDPHKNLETLIDAFAILKNQEWLPHKLVIVGGRHLPEYTRMIEGKIENLSLVKDVIIAPYIQDKDLPAVYNLADLLVYPSLLEGFGLPVVEAMQCGIPVITSDISALAEVAGGAAILVDPRDTKQLSSKIFEVLNNSSLRRELVKKGLDRSKIFSWHKTAAEMFGIIASR